MNKSKIAILGIVALFAILSVSTASANVTLYFVPQDSSVPEGEGYSAYVEVWASVEDPDTAKSGQFAIHYDPSCVNIIDHPVNGAAEGWGGDCIDHTMSSWNAQPICYGPGYDMVMYTFAFTIPHTFCPTPRMIANFTVQCVSSEYCLSELSVTCGEAGCFSCPIEILDGSDANLYPDSTTFVDGTFTCGEAQTFEKGLVKGWNLISLPLTPENNSAAKVLETVSYDAVYGYSATAPRGFENVATMVPGKGYFVNVTASGQTWTYNGTPYTSMNVSIEQGLNMVGWLNCSKSVSDGLSSLDGKYNYVAMFNATSQRFEAYNPHAPSVFNDFTNMTRGTGYFISARAGCPRLNESCTP